MDASDVGQTGARFGSPASRRRRQQADPPEPQKAPQPPEPDHAAASLDTTKVAAPPVEDVIGDTRWDEPEYSLVRPYAWTGGRTETSYDLALETLISTNRHSASLASHTASLEHRSIAEICAMPRSVAEVAALLSLPLGVVRVLLGDMAAAGSIIVHRTASMSGALPDLALMERVLNGLRRL